MYAIARRCAATVSRSARATRAHTAAEGGEARRSARERLPPTAAWLYRFACSRRREPRWAPVVLLAAGHDGALELCRIGASCTHGTRRSALRRGGTAREREVRKLCRIYAPSSQEISLAVEFARELRATYGPTQHSVTRDWRCDSLCLVVLSNEIAKHCSSRADALISSSHQSEDNTSEFAQTVLWALKNRAGLCDISRP